MKVLVYGAGQLAQMMYLAGVPLGVEVLAVDVSKEQIVHPVSKDLIGFDLQAALNWADNVTVEFEHIPEHLLLLAQEVGKLSPNMPSVLAGADRVREKKLLSDNHIPNCQHLIIDDIAALDSVTAELGERVIFKASRDGYDGYGQWRASNEAEITELKTVFRDLDLRAVPIIAERMMPFERELSVLGARNANGEIACFPIAENLHHQGQLHISVAPATELSQAITRQAEDIFHRLIKAMDYVGVLAVELFQVGDAVLVNEIAPRVHNSGHWTQNACQTNQFEQHLRAVLNLPLGATQATGVGAMVNIIGFDGLGPEHYAPAGLHLHWYGKTLREKRKMGHFNLQASTYADLGKQLHTLSALLPTAQFPELADEAKRLMAIK